MSRSPSQRGYPQPVPAPSNNTTGRRVLETNADDAAPFRPLSTQHQRRRTLQPQRQTRAFEQFNRRFGERNQTFEDMFTSMRAPRRDGPSGNMLGGVAPSRSGRNVTLPQWQPDSDVTHCFHCQSEFTWYFRKHHCRKCGRVVCANCSSHKITIPRQYIVQPPHSSDEEQSSPSLARRGSYNNNLESGAIVRVCNPCVPDPWLPGPSFNRQSQPPRHQQQHSANRTQAMADEERRRRDQINWPSGLSGPTSSESFFWRENMAGPISYDQQPSQPSQPTHTVREEDQCPVNGCEMEGDEAAREAHIQWCIRHPFGTPPADASAAQAPANFVQSFPTLRDLGSDWDSQQLHNPRAYLPMGEEPPAPPTPPRPRAPSYRPRGLVVYKATEKDCVTADGEKHECVICMEEFEPGDQLGRMECLCKFHRTCIRTWWDTKGHGACPTHQLLGSVS